jgi:phage terminase small subunit
VLDVCNVKKDQRIMPKARKTLTQLAESGSLDRNPGRYASRYVAQVAPHRPIGAAPAHLPAAEKKIWKDLVRASQPGLLQKSDRFYLELCCKLVSRMRAGDVKASELNSVANILSKLGMNPVDRIKLGVESPADPSKSKDKDEWDELDQLD